MPLFQMYRAEYAPLEFPHRPAVHPPLPYKEAFGLIRANWEEGDIVVHTGTSSWLVLYHYGFPGHAFGDVPAYNAGMGSAYINNIRDINPLLGVVLTEKGRQEMPILAEIAERWVPREVQLLTADRTRVWVVFTDWERLFLKGNSTAVWRWMDSHFSEVRHEDFDGMEIFLDERESEGSQGIPDSIAVRDKDDGISAVLTHSAGTDGPYLKWRPDNGLVRSAREARRGKLLLRFEEEESGEVASPASGSDTKPISIVVENHSGHDIEAHLDIVASDYLLKTAALYEALPDSEEWQIGPKPNMAGPPGEYELSVAKVHLIKGTTAPLQGEIRLPTGNYYTAVYSLGTPGDVEHRRAQLNMQIGGQDLFAGIATPSPGPLSWQWIPDHPVEVKDGARATSVILTAIGNEDPLEVWGDIGYVAFRRKRPTDGADSSDAGVWVWEEELTVPQHNFLNCSIRLPVKAERIDAWVYERGAGGQAYHIFRKQVE